ncbi:hypothetical protein [Spirosoma rigui]|uniref:hypothetical protein n=1 Tax=Spirosoma rigui TaxID=564064 RepID=UPI0009B19319|nr:hypothetical protein [Spirosoma rigui]
MHPLYRYIRQGLVSALLFVATGAWSQLPIPDPQWIKTYPDLHYISYTSNKNQLAITADGAILHNGIKYTLLGDTLQRMGTPTGTTTDGESSRFILKSTTCLHSIQGVSTPGMAIRK